MTALLRFENLSIARGERVLQRGLSGAVGPGELLHVSGANGSGKTTLLQVLAGLRAPVAGSVHRRGDPEHLHWVGHRNAISTALGVEENLRFWCALQGVPAQGIAPALARFGLQRLSRPCRELSAGQNRRAALARLVAARRPLWLLDEPLAALDRQGIELFFDELGTHCAGGGAAVLTSHQPLPPGLRVRELVLA
ncbi:MAG TPA: heme ABC exporter ATP-binding protein CcmA [Candidatus Binatia bacterium]|nr:heme ABC exporter ATP-binding protein CcmA [Candidatus Binatia bacterium]